MATLLELAAKLQSANAPEGMLWMLLKATLILAVARLLLSALPRASAATKHLIATAVLIAVATMPVLSVVVPAWEVVVEKRSRTLPADELPAARTEASSLQPAASPSERKTHGVSDSEAISTAISVARAIVPEEPLTAIDRAANVARSTWKGLIVVTLGIVALLLLAQMGLGMLGVWFVAKRAEELTTDEALRELDSACDQLALGREVRLLRSSRISVPVIWGVFRPVLLLPADVVLWPVERLRVVLLHELAHLKRFDGISLILTRIAVSLFWFHPLAWSLERAGRSECERACDDLVLASGTKPSDYADHLLAIARSMPAFDPFRSVTLAMSRKSQLEGRLLSILQTDTARRVFSGRGVAVACALAVAVIIPVSALRLTATPSEAKNQAPVIKEETRLASNDEITRSDSEVTVTPDVEAIGDYLLAKLGKYDKRADRWMREPRNGKDWYERAYDLYHNERYEEAAAAFRRAADEGYRPDTALYNAACSYALIGDATRSLAELDRAIEAGWDDFDHIADDSDFDPIREDRRFASMLQGKLSDVASRRVKEAVEKYNELKTDRYADAEDWYEVGLDLLRLRRVDEGIHAFEKSIAANEKVGASMYNIACGYSLKGDAAGAMKWLEKAIDNGYSAGDEKFENDPDLAFVRKYPGFEALKERARDLEMKGCCENEWVRTFVDNWDKSVDHHREMVRKYPDSGRAWFNLGYTALQAREFKTAEDAWRRAMDLGYRVGTTSYNMACTYALQDNRDAAFDWLNRARAAGFDLDDYLDDDDDLDSLKRDPRWDALRREVR